MTSTTRFMTSGAVALALGSLLLVAQPSLLQGGTALGAADPPYSSSFTGTVTELEDNTDGTVRRIDGLTYSDAVTHALRWDATDSRLSGDVATTANWLNDWRPADAVGVRSTTYELTNDEGSWLGEGTSIEGGVLAAGGQEGLWLVDTIILTGRDGYEGLTASVIVDWSGDLGVTLRGVVLPAPMPELPGALAD